MDPLLEFYNRALAQNGVRSPRALGWRDEHSQFSRFRVLCQIADLRGASILDEGCGLGDLYPYLTERFPGIRYTGLDINPDMIAAAGRKYPAASFVAADFSDFTGGPFDYVLSSGALTLKVPDFKTFYFGHIRKMYELAEKGVAFNMLRASVIGEDLTYAAYDPAEVEAFCRTLTDNVALRQDYSDEDFTLYLYK